MTRDYAKKKRAAPSRKNSNPIPWWVWLLTGSALGAFIMFLLYLGKIEPTGKPTTAQSMVKAEPPEPTETPQTSIPQPRFDFYKLLKESEVIVPATEPNNAEGNPQTLVKSEYILQVGSFKSANDADKLRVQLILLNLAASTEAVTVRNEDWHRVIVGPFDNQSRLAKARSTLVSNRYNALVLKRKLPTR